MTPKHPSCITWLMWRCESGIEIGSQVSQHSFLMCTPSWPVTCSCQACPPLCPTAPLLTLSCCLPLFPPSSLPGLVLLPHPTPRYCLPPSLPAGTSQESWRRSCTGSVTTRSQTARAPTSLAMTTSAWTRHSPWRCVGLAEVWSETSAWQAPAL